MCVAPVDVKIEKSHLNGFKYQQCACRRCKECLRSRQIDWFTRMAWELQERPTAYFTTLTYSPENVPWTDQGQTLLREDLTLFNKRLLKYVHTHGFADTYRHYSVGEYGGKTFRPHYHQIIFIDNNRINEFAHIVSDTWAQGHVTVSRVKPTRLMYCAGYADKRIKNMVNFDDDDQRLPEFNQMSKGIGLNYLTEERIRFHKEGLNLRIWDPINHHTRRLPQYYINKIWKTNLERLPVLKKRRLLMQEPHFETRDDEIYYEVLKTAHTIKAQKWSTEPSLRIAI